MDKKRTRRRNTIGTFVSSEESTLAPESERFDAAIETFLRHCRVKNLTDESVKYYRNTLNILADTLRGMDVTRPIDVDEGVIDAVILKTKESVSDASVNTYMRGWRPFFRFLREEGYIFEDVGDYLKPIKTEKRMIHAFTKEQMKQLLDAPDRTKFTGYRDYVIMLMMLETGMRVSELAGVQLADIYWKERLIKVHGKGRKDRVVPFQKTLDKHLREYVKIRGLLDHEFLFVNIDNEPLKKRSIQDLIKDYGRDAGIKGVRVSPHTFRHTFAKFYIMNGGDPFSLQKILGHESIDTVKIYVNLFSVDIAAQHSRYSPLERLDE